MFVATLDCAIVIFRTVCSNEKHIKTWSMLQRKNEWKIQTACTHLTAWIDWLESADGVVQVADGVVHSAQDAVNNSPTIFESKSKVQPQWTLPPQWVAQINIDTKYARFTNEWKCHARFADEEACLACRQSVDPADSNAFRVAEINISEWAKSKGLAPAEEAFSSAQVRPKTDH